ncbi:MULTISPECIES: hypothetical protein [unclassified Bradyrhizobium]|uniref:hypothetical protein n=1 Tax=unclassified Bradyrhizobium TaxID=2631580 RepID=UPI002478A6E6|nr:MULTISPECIES: hypothetical protein [unclassified Bradyrhizobium]WGS20428.1 hypothetical protein MTX22_00855 [Bradyrhizobium sp. ISRA463]WGS27309.1 hypothetical protein MTX19_37735 [Bradyrhizobium sp. ISRA464]
MLALWIIGLAFVGSGLAAVLFGVSALETPFGSALFGSGLIFVASGVVISGLGLVVRKLDRLREAIETRAELPLAEPTETVPAIATATVERQSPLRSRDAKRQAAQDARAAEDAVAPQEPAHPLIGRSSRPGRSSLPARRTPASEARQAPAVVHSGTVNNMDYQLRADGTIVAMLPGRKLEFASIDELRARLASLPDDDEDTSAGQRSA